MWKSLIFIPYSNNQYIILKTWNINSKFTDRAQCRVFPYAIELNEAYGPDSRHVSWKRPHGVPWWTRPYRTAHASPLKRGKHAQCGGHYKTNSWDELSGSQTIWIIAIWRTCLCISWYACESHVSVAVWYLHNFDCKPNFHLSSV